MGKRPEKTRILYLTKEDTEMTSPNMKKYSLSFAIRELQIKTAMRYHHIPTRMAKIQNTDNSKCSQGCGGTGILIHCS